MQRGNKRQMAAVR